MNIELGKAALQDEGKVFLWYRCTSSVEAELSTKLIWVKGISPDHKLAAALKTRLLSE